MQKLLSQASGSCKCGYKNRELYFCVFRDRPVAGWDQPFRDFISRFTYCRKMAEISHLEEALVDNLIQ